MSTPLRVLLVDDDDVDRRGVVRRWNFSRHCERGERGRDQTGDGRESKRVIHHISDNMGDCLAACLKAVLYLQR